MMVARLLLPLVMKVSEMGGGGVGDTLPETKFKVI